MKLQYLTSVSKPSNELTGSIFIEDMDANEVEDLLNKKRTIEKQIANIQATCHHTNQVIRMVYLGSSHEVRWVCESCSLAVGWPNDKETQRFLSKKV
jgi:hypothetical protein